MKSEKKLKNKIGKKKALRPGKKKHRRKFRIAIIAMLSFFLFLITTAGIVFYLRYGNTIFALQADAKAMVRKSTEDTFRSALTSLVYTADGELLSVLKSEKEVYYLDYDDIPQYVIDAMLVTEDKKFFTHGGVDLLANIRASILLIKNKGEIHQGASTITQQLARNIFLTNEVTFERKIKEIFVATALEKKYTKQQILEFYLNNIYFANGLYGIQAASNGYFNRGVSELSLSQIAFLCAIPNNPTLYDPVVNFSNTMERRDKVLIQMMQDGVISKQQYDKAVSEKIKLKNRKKRYNNYMESYINYCAVRVLMAEEGFVFKNEFTSKMHKENYEDSYYEAYYRIQKTLFTGGYRIYTSLDPEKQKMLQNSVDQELYGFSEVNEEGTFQLQGAAVCIDNDTGRVAAIVGGRSQETDGYTLNRAYQSYRQPGSAIKPLIVYTPCFERGYYPDNIVVDEPIKGGPKNAEGTYSGEITLQRAIEVSKNTIAWKLFEELTPSIGLSYLYTMGFGRIVNTDYVPAASLGGLTYGVSAVELASGYAAIENDGIYRVPSCIVKITDSNGIVIVSDHQQEKAVYQKNAARIMTNALEGVMTQGTGRHLKLDNMSSAGKTGTTNDRKDGWFAGYTKYYTTVVWVGYDMPKKLSDLGGNSYPGRIWQSFMQNLHKDLENIAFESFLDNRTPEEIQKADKIQEMDADKEKLEEEKPVDGIDTEEKLDKSVVSDDIGKEEQKEPGINGDNWIVDEDECTADYEDEGTTDQEFDFNDPFDAEDSKESSDDSIDNSEDANSTEQNDEIDGADIMDW